MRKFLFFLAVPCAASTITYDIQENLPLTSLAFPASFSIPVPEFNGSLPSMDWSLNATFWVHEGINDMYMTPGIPYTASLELGIASDPLGLSNQTGYSFSGVTTGLHEISMGGGAGIDSVSLSGTAPDPSVFEGTGTFAIPLVLSNQSWATNGVVAAITTVYGSVDLQLNYDPVDPVPEPRWLALTLLVPFAWRLRSSGRPKSPTPFQNC